MQARVIFGSASSMLDLVTDVYITAYFMGEGKEGYFQASLASLTMSIGVQLLEVWIQNKGIGWGKVLCESFPILIGFKPAVDAYGVAAGAEQEKGQSSDPMI